ncbi:F-box domain-containing protein [Caenorhabditis elegans]|uniref:F-box domain-containing protein n=1 Tax=Caenorhabditis elegans TaxID=6239 RepID=Q19758_CAEEL|nr:F-box domain-containing protein [Caenorhabditis elegans]CAA94914.1 F-box domain-containing protein [Caenorhabditis elegans]|eukprot:NP_510404.1 Uncharacterized protein CELE_F23D12.4 [Caenorhabditis elegans]
MKKGLTKVASKKTEKPFLLEELPSLPLGDIVKQLPMFELVKLALLSQKAKRWVLEHSRRHLVQLTVNLGETFIIKIGYDGEATNEIVNIKLDDMPPKRVYRTRSSTRLPMNLLKIDPIFPSCCAKNTYGTRVETVKYLIKYFSKTFKMISMELTFDKQPDAVILDIINLVNHLKIKMDTLAVAGKNNSDEVFKCIIDEVSRVSSLQIWGFPNGERLLGLNDD